MHEVIVNAIGDACPIPVVKAKKALDGMKEAGILEIHVDNEMAVQNLSRFAAGQGFQVTSEKNGEKHFCVKIQVSAFPERKEETVSPSCISDLRGEQVIAIDGAVMGRGDDKLGTILMKSFLYAVSQQEQLPRTMLFYNGGAKLTVEGSPALEDIKSMEAQGVEVLTCGTCLDFYGLSNQLAVGSVTNMYAIVEKLSQAAKVIKP